MERTRLLRLLEQELECGMRLMAYDTIWNAYVELRAWIVENGCVESGPVREVGVVTDLDTDDARQGVTELAVPPAT